MIAPCNRFGDYNERVATLLQQFSAALSIEATKLHTIVTIYAEQGHLDAHDTEMVMGFAVAMMHLADEMEATRQTVAARIN